MDYFNYRNNLLHAEDVALDALAQQIGTPFYCYSQTTLERHIDVFASGLAELDATICYAVKANSNLSVLKVLAAKGAGADVVSEGEIRRALAAGIAPQKIIFSGVGKTKAEMGFALEAGIYQFNVESAPELEALQDVAASKGIMAPVALRINPDVDALTHAKISTGRQENKFGIAMDEALALYVHAKETMPNIILQGVSMHIGSQLVSLEPFRAAYARGRQFVQELASREITLKSIDVGGGLGIPYEASGITPPDPRSYGQIVHEAFADFGCRIIVEPGRLIVGNAGLLVARVIYVKHSGRRRFIILDAAMNDLMRPALYDAHHDIVAVHDTTSALTPADVVGPVCETGDTFAIQRPMPPLRAGDLVAFRSAGAYGAVMAGSYNSRLLIPEVLVHGEQAALIRPRPTYEDLLRQDRIAPWL